MAQFFSTVILSFRKTFCRPPSSLNNFRITRLWILVQYNTTYLSNYKPPCIIIFRRLPLSHHYMTHKLHLPLYYDFRRLLSHLLFSEPSRQLIFSCYVYSTLLQLIWVSSSAPGDQVSQPQSDAPNVQFYKPLSNSKADNCFEMPKGFYFCRTFCLVNFAAYFRFTPAISSGGPKINKNLLSGELHYL